MKADEREMQALSDEIANLEAILVRLTAHFTLADTGCRRRWRMEEMMARMSERTPSMR
jgi:hypothetical protein